MRRLGATNLKRRIETFNAVCGSKARRRRYQNLKRRIETHYVAYLSDAPILRPNLKRRIETYFIQVANQLIKIIGISREGLKLTYELYLHFIDVHSVVNLKRRIETRTRNMRHTPHCNLSESQKKG